MSRHLLIVHSRHRESGADLMRRALPFVGSLGLAPASSAIRASFAAAEIGYFPFEDRDDPGFVETGGGGAPGAWACGAGAWFVNGLAGRPALVSLLGSLPALLGGRAAEIENAMGGADGAYAIAAGERSSGDFVLVTDRLGSLHIYSADLGDCLLLSTSALLLGALLRPGWDVTACREFLCTGSVYEDRSLFRGVRKLEPATVFRYSDGALASRHRYWTPASIHYIEAPPRAHAENVAAALQSAVAVIGRNCPKPVFDLTGGFDSRAVVAAALAGGIPFSTVVAGDRDSSDVEAAGRIATAFGFDHRWMPGTCAGPEETWDQVRRSLAYTDGEFDLVLYHSVLRVHEDSARGYDISVNGSNGEIAKGYWWEILKPPLGSNTEFDPASVAARRYAFESEPRGLLASEFEDSIVDHFAGVIDRANAGLAARAATAKLDNVYLALRMQRWQGRIASSTLRLWPCASPFAFRGPMEAALAVPAPQRAGCRLSRRVIEMLSPALAAMPMAEGYPASPRRWSNFHRFLLPAGLELARRARHAAGRRLGRPPMSGGALSSYDVLRAAEPVRSLLRPETMASRHLYNPVVLSRVLAESMQPGGRNAMRFSRILTLEMVARAVSGC